MLRLISFHYSKKESSLFSMQFAVSWKFSNLRTSLILLSSGYLFLRPKKVGAFKSQYHKDTEKPSTLLSKSPIDAKQTHQLDLFIHTHFVAPQSVLLPVCLLFSWARVDYLNARLLSTGIRKKISIRECNLLEWLCAVSGGVHCVIS